MKYRATYLIPGILFPDETTRELSAHDPEEAKRLAPKNAYCFTLYDLEELPYPVEMIVDSKKFDIRPKPQNESKRYYLGGTVVTYDAMVAFKPEDWPDNTDDHSILLSNARINGYKKLIYCRTGNWQPLDDDDIVLEME